MTHTYQINGMTCAGCAEKVKTSLLAVADITDVVVSKEKGSVSITMNRHTELNVLQEALGGNRSKYKISIPNSNSDQPEEQKECCSTHKPTHTANNTNPKNQGKYYCPMHCEGDKVYDKAGDCPVCGMDLVQQPIFARSTQYTCPMHPKVIKDKPGSCPICGMDLVPIAATESEEQKTYFDLLKKFKVALVFTLPIFIIAMVEMLPNNPLLKLMDIY
jgi:copper chaperone CopZ